MKSFDDQGVEIRRRKITEGLWPTVEKVARSTVVDSSNRSLEEDEVIEFEFQSSEVEQEDNFFESEETPDTKALDYSSGPLQTGSAAQSGTLLDTRVKTTTSSSAGSETGAASSLRTGSKNDSGTGSGTDLLTGSGTGVKAVSRTSSETGSKTGSKTGSGQDLAEAGFVDWGDVEMEEKVNLEKKTSKPIKRKKKKRPKARIDLWPSKKVGQKFGRLSVSTTSTVASTTTAMSTSALTSPTVESETAIFDYDVTTHAVTYLDEATASTYQSPDFQELAGSPTSGANSTDPSQPSGRESQDNVFETSESSSQLCSATETHLRDLVSDLQRQVLDLTTALKQKVITTHKLLLRLL